MNHVSLNTLSKAIQLSANNCKHMEVETIQNLANYEKFLSTAITAEMVKDGTIRGVHKETGTRFIKFTINGILLMDVDIDDNSVKVYYKSLLELLNELDRQGEKLFIDKELYDCYFTISMSVVA